MFALLDKEYSYKEFWDLLKYTFAHLVEMLTFELGLKKTPQARKKKVYQISKILKQMLC